MIPFPFQRDSGGPAATDRNSFCATCFFIVSHFGYALRDLRVTMRGVRAVCVPERSCFKKAGRR